MRAKLVLLLTVVLASASCSSPNNRAPQQPAASVTASTSTSAEPVSPLAGRWQMETACQMYVNALDKAGLSALAPGVLAGNGLVPGSPQQLAKKADICQGATARVVHSHFFTPSGDFGSVDWTNQQVDDGHYKVINSRTFVIGDSTFHYRILNEDKLMMYPVIPAALKRQALAHPTKFSAAGWMVAVALPGYTWERVDCAGWC